MEKDTNALQNFGGDGNMFYMLVMQGIQPLGEIRAPG